jgi:Sulfotransferase family
LGEQRHTAVCDPALPESIALFGCPRSGTTWLGQLFNHHEAVAYRYQPLFAYEFKDWFGRHGVSACSVRAFHAALLDAQSSFVLQSLQPVHKQSPPRCLIWKEVRFHQIMAPLLATGALDRVVYLLRDPVAVLNSWYQAPKEFRAGQDIHAQWRDAPAKNTDPSEFNGFTRWKASLRLALALAEAQPDRMRLVRYERLRADPRGQMGALLAWAGLPCSAQVDAFIDESTSRQEEDAYSVFRSRAAALTLPPAIVEAIRADEDAGALLAAADRLAVG